MKPPRLARLLILLVVPASERDFFLGDLLEEFQERVRSEGLRRANAWYWRQTLRSPGWWRRTSTAFAPAGAELKRGETIQGIVQDIRYAFRSLRKNKSLVIFALAALAVLFVALGLWAWGPFGGRGVPGAEMPPVPDRVVEWQPGVDWTPAPSSQDGSTVAR